MSYTQTARLCRLRSPLGDDALILQSLTGTEGISRLFDFTVEASSEDSRIAAADIIGQPVCIELGLAEGGERFFHGIVAEFQQTGADTRLANYRVEVRPWLWFLTRRADCRIFQHQPTPEIVTQVFERAGFHDFEMRLSRGYRNRAFCVQYRETDFNFVSRLLEEEGICYFFEHEAGRHTLVLADSPDVLPSSTADGLAHYQGSTGGQLGRDEIRTWRVGQTLHPGRYSLRDYNFEDPSNPLAVNSRTLETIADNPRFEIYDHHPRTYGTIEAGEAVVRTQIEAEETARHRIEGEGDCRAFTSGHRFTLADHYRHDFNDVTYVLVNVSHRLIQPSALETGQAPQATYENSFTCAVADTPYRPPRVTPKPSITGPQTAVVVGKSGEEIDVDEYGRIHVQFHWDREGQKDEKSSCRVRVSQQWAGKKWGAIAHPRIGDEVIVEFLEGDPDEPIVTGCVYNKQRMPPYDLPTNKTQTGIKTRSTKDGTPDNFNEIRFEDKRGAEELSIQAEKDMTLLVKNDQKQTVQRDGSADVTRDRSASVGRDETSSVGNNSTRSVGVDDTFSVGSNQTTTIGANATETVGADKVVDVGSSLLLKAGSSITLQCGASTISMNSAGIITISGMLVTMAGTACANVAAPITNIAGAAMLTCSGAMNLVNGGVVRVTSGNAHIGGSKVVVDGGETIIKGAPIKLN